MLGYANPKWYYEFEKKLCLFAGKKINFIPPCSYGDATKICKLILGTLGMPGYTQPKW